MASSVPCQTMAILLAAAEAMSTSSNALQAFHANPESGQSRRICVLTYVLRIYLGVSPPLWMKL